MVTVSEVPTVPAVDVKVFEIWPAAICMEAGTGKLVASELARLMVVAPVGTATLNVTVHVVVVPGVNVVGVHAMMDNCGVA